MKPSVIVTWPRHYDYPLFRYNLKRFSPFLGKIYIGFTNHHLEEDYSNFVRANLDATCIDIERTANGDWRDDAVNALLNIAEGEHILFLEQDFLIANEGFFDIFNQNKDFIYYNENDRIHPAFALVKRELIEKTHKDFAPYPPKDHFGHFFEEVLLLTEGFTLEQMGKKWKDDFYHMQGLTQNYKSFRFGDSFFRPNTFLYFNYKSSLLPDQSPFLGIMQQLNNFSRPKQHEFLDNFFPE